MLLTNTTVADGEIISADRKIPEVKVTVHVPDEVSDTIKQQKINHLYDILKPKEKCTENAYVA